MKKYFRLNSVLSIASRSISRLSKRLVLLAVIMILSFPASDFRASGLFSSLPQILSKEKILVAREPSSKVTLNRSPQLQLNQNQNALPEESPQVGRWSPLGEPGVGGWVTSVSVDPNNSKHLIIGGDLLATGVSFDGGQSFLPGLGFKSCEIGDCTFHPKNGNIVWAGTMSGPYLSTDGGQTWQEKRGGFPKIADYHYSAPIEKILFDPNDENHLMAFGGSSRRWHSPSGSDWGAVWESRNAGESWSKISSLDKNIVSAAYVPGSSNELYAAVDQSGLFHSQDGGKTWIAVNNGLPHLNIERVRVCSKMPKTVYISLGAGPLAEDEKGRKLCLTGGIFRSDDGGRTWTEKPNGFVKKRDVNPYLTSGFKAFDWSSSDPQVLYAGDRAWNVDMIYRSLDGGESWTPMLNRSPSDPQKVFTMKCAYFSGAGGTVMTIDPNNAQIAYGAGAEFVVRTMDSGKSWEDITARKVGDPNERCWIGRGYSGLCCTGFYFDPYHRGRSVFTAMDAGKCWESTDFMKTWIFRGFQPTPWGGGNMASFAKDGTVYVTTGQGNSNGSVLRGNLPSQGGWTNLKGEEHNLPDFNKCMATGIYVLPDDSSKVWLVINRKLYYSKDSGEHWTLLFDREELGWLAADPHHPRTFYLSGNENVWKTTDGEHFESIGGPKVAGRMTVDRIGRLLIAAYRGKMPGLWRFNGTNWSWLKKDYYVRNIAVDPLDEKRILMIGNDDPFHDHVRSSVWASSNDGQNFYEVVNGLPVRRGGAVAFNPFDSEEVILGTNGSGFFQAKFPRKKN